MWRWNGGGTPSGMAWAEMATDYGKIQQDAHTATETGCTPAVIPFLHIVPLCHALKHVFKVVYESKGELWYMSAEGTRYLVV